MSTKKVLAKGISCCVLMILILCGFGLSANAYEISGTVRNDSNQPIDGTQFQIQVDIYEGDPCGMIEWRGYAMVAANGSYNIQDLDSGQYYLLSNNTHTHDYLNEWWTGNTDPSSSYCSEHADR